MNILIVNAGSSSLKYQMIDSITEETICKGVVERIGLKNSCIIHSVGNKKYKSTPDMKNHIQALKVVLDELTHPKYKVIDDISQLGAVGHRIVHAGEDFDKSVVIDDKVIEIMKSNSELAPLHMPANIDCVIACKQVLPNTPMVAVFDTAFHMGMPEKAYLYGIKYEDYEKYKVRKYGFHGSSHKFVSQEAYKLLGKEKGKIVTCHLGNGSSISAIEDGISVDTSMGFTPLEGLIMGTRCGDIDAGAVSYLASKLGMNLTEIINYLNKECGLEGVSGVSSDSRDIFSAIEEGNERAQISIDILVYKIIKYIGAFTAAMNGIDCIVFTGGIGENVEYVREKVLDSLSFLNLKYSKKYNNSKSRDTREITLKSSKVKAYVIPTNEELIIARDTKALVE